MGGVVVLAVVNIAALLLARPIESLPMPRVHLHGAAPVASPPKTCECCDAVCSKEVLSFDASQTQISWQLSWQLNLTTTPHSTIQITLSGGAEPDVRWLGLGFQPNGAAENLMVGATAVICQPAITNQPTNQPMSMMVAVAGYALNAAYLKGVVPIPNFGLTNASVSSNLRNETRCSFTAPFGPGTPLAKVNQHANPLTPSATHCTNSHQ
jgi:hypothetical protein